MSDPLDTPTDYELSKTVPITTWASWWAGGASGKGRLGEGAGLQAKAPDRGWR